MSKARYSYSIGWNVEFNEYQWRIWRLRQPEELKGRLIEDFGLCEVHIGGSGNLFICCKQMMDKIKEVEPTHHSLPLIELFMRYEDSYLGVLEARRNDAELGVAQTQPDEQPK